MQKEIARKSWHYPFYGQLYEGLPPNNPRVCFYWGGVVFGIISTICMLLILVALVSALLLAPGVGAIVVNQQPIDLSSWNTYQSAGIYGALLWLGVAVLVTAGFYGNRFLVKKVKEWRLFKLVSDWYNRRCSRVTFVD